MLYWLNLALSQHTKEPNWLKVSAGEQVTATGVEGAGRVGTIIQGEQVTAAGVEGQVWAMILNGPGPPVMLARDTQGPPQACEGGPILQVILAHSFVCMSVCQALAYALSQ